ncbi:MAG TPA: hypothetical protein PK129_06080, partial [Cellvibrionaceae bacterium]|nr:hypothetical protein [Cellvibrionaceae bacterium]
MEPTIQLKLAIASHLAYASVDTIASASFAHGLEFFVQHNINNHSVSCFQFGGSAVVSFRGTNDASDWKSNLLIIPVKRPWGWVHLGFIRAAEALWDRVRDTIQGDFVCGRDLYFTGH